MKKEDRIFYKALIGSFLIVLLIMFGTMFGTFSDKWDYFFFLGCLCQSISFIIIFKLSHYYIKNEK